MDKSDIIKRELKQLDSTVRSYLQYTEEVLGSMRNETVKLWLTKNDQYSLLTLKVWEDKYKVSLKFILIILLPFWETFVQRRSKKMKRAGLNVRVSTLIGKKSEQILQESIKKLYPNGENIQMWLAEERERIIQNQLHKLEKLNDDGVHSRSDPSSMRDTNGRILNLSDFSTPKQFLTYYRSYMKKEHITRDKLEEQMKKRSYRNNPFKPETL
jgi:hypothetical protein